MINRVELKENAKKAFKNNYWNSVLVSIIFAFFLGGTYSASSKVTYNAADNKIDLNTSTTSITTFIKENPEVFAIIVATLIGIIIVVSIIATLFNTFISNPISMGCRSFFLKNIDNPNTEVSEIKIGFTPNYMRNVITLFLKGLFIALWSLLFIIPGIIMGYAYTLTPYILAEDPDIKPMDAIRKSKEMMKGHKMEAFILDLSFLGWILLSALTLGLLFIFYVNPYMAAAEAQFYKEIKEASTY